MDGLKIYVLIWGKRRMGINNIIVIIIGLPAMFFTYLEKRKEVKISKINQIDYINSVCCIFLILFVCLLRK